MYESFVKELISYIDQAEKERNSHVVAVSGIRAMWERHQTSVKPPTFDFKPKYEHNVTIENGTLREANTLA